jgi:hypothetical protein
MSKQEHLSDEQFTAIALGEPSPEAAAHLAECSACREEQQRLVAALAGMKHQIDTLAERPAGFWYAQRAAMAARLGERFTGRWQLLTWASTLAALILAAVLVMPRGEGPTNEVQQADPDHQLLVEIEEATRRSVPRALEPALLLTQELSQAAARAESR